MRRSTLYTLPIVCRTPNSASRIRTTSLPRRAQTPSAGSGPASRRALSLASCSGESLGAAPGGLGGPRGATPPRRYRPAHSSTNRAERRRRRADPAPLQLLPGPQQDPPVGVRLQRLPLGGHETAEAIEV